MTLTRKERESLVIDLLNKCTPIREIASQASLSFRDIGAIKKKAEEGKEAKQGEARQIFISTQAYKLFSEGKSPVQVAIALNIREPEVARFYVEYWKLVQHHSLNWVYEQVKDDIRYFVKLYISAKVARMGVEQVVRLLEIANNDLPVVEHRYERLKREIDEIEAEKHNSARILQDLSDQMTTMRKTLDQYKLSCKEQRLELTKLQVQKVRLQELVDNFQNDDEEYIKIRNTAKEKVVSILSDRKVLLKLALLSLIESTRNDPDKYISLIYNKRSSTPSTSATSTTGYSSSDQYYNTASWIHELRQQQYPPYDYISMLLEESEKLYDKLAKELGDESISDYTFSITSSSLPLLSPSDEKEQQSHSRQTTAANQSYMHTAEHRFVQSEIDNEDQDK
jgi:hypothetical protein